jgi:TPR repeat protein
MGWLAPVVLVGLFTQGACTRQGTDGAQAEIEDSGACRDATPLSSDVAPYESMGLQFDLFFLTPDRAEDAAAEYRDACDDGFPAACTNLGVLYATGKDVTPNDTQAVDLFTAACDAGQAVACTNLGLMLQSGRGVTAPDARRAQDLFEKTCSPREPVACLEAGRGYLHDPNNPPDYEAAARVFRTACRQAPTFCGSLGRLLAECPALALPEDNALDLLRSACAAPIWDAPSCHTLAVLLDDDESEGLFRKACEQGEYQPACERLPQRDR